LLEYLEAELATKSAKDLALMFLGDQSMEKRQASGDCTTEGLSAKCCGRVQFAGKLDVDACVLAEVLPDDLAIHVQLTILGHVVIDETVSAHDPPALCASIPDVSFMKMCVKLSDLELNGDTFHGCFALSAKIFGKTVVTVDLGCVNIG